MNEEKKLPEENLPLENANTEINQEKKKLPLTALIGIIAGAVAVIVAVVLIILLGGKENGGNTDGGNSGDGGDQQCTHVDKDDDYLCDKCGKHFDDGDEVALPDIKSSTVIFTVSLDNGTPLSGVKFVLTRGDKVYELTSGTDGTVSATIDVGSYYVDYDSETLPEYCWGETFGVKVEEGTDALSITVVDNRPDGSTEKPFPTVDEIINIDLAPGEQHYYLCRGTSVKYVTIYNSDLAVIYNDETYYADADGKIEVGVASSDVDTPILFAVKNISDSHVTDTMQILAPLGSYENPIAVTDSGAVAELADGQSVYYKYTADKNGILVLSTPTVGCEVLITRNIVVINADGEEEILSTITSSADSNTDGTIYVANGDEIVFCISYVAPTPDAGDPASQSDDELVSVEFSVSLYSATAVDPAPVTVNMLDIRLDAGASVVFAIDAGKTVCITSDSGVTATLGGVELLIGQEAIATEQTTLSVNNPTDEMGVFKILVK